MLDILIDITTLKATTMRLSKKDYKQLLELVQQNAEANLDNLEVLKELQPLESKLYAKVYK